MRLNTLNDVFVTIKEKDQESRTMEVTVTKENKITATTES